jgi:hypothetical protein
MAEKDQREQEREVAAKNFNSPIMTLAAAYGVNQGGGYGVEGSNAVYQFLYPQALDSPEAGGLAGKALAMAAGQNAQNRGINYSENVTGANVIQLANQILYGSLGKLKVSDLIKVRGSEKKVEKNYADMYVADLVKDKSERGQQIAGQLVGNFQRWLEGRSVAQALAIQDKAMGKSLDDSLEPKEK